MVSEFNVDDRLRVIFLSPFEYSERRTLSYIYMVGTNEIERSSSMRSTSSPPPLALEGKICTKKKSIILISNMELIIGLRSALVRYRRYIPLVDRGAGKFATHVEHRCEILSSCCKCGCRRWRELASSAVTCSSPSPTSQSMSTSQQPTRKWNLRVRSQTILYTFSVHELIFGFQLILTSLAMAIGAGLSGERTFATLLKIPCSFLDRSSLSRVCCDP